MAPQFSLQVIAAAQVVSATPVTHPQAAVSDTLQVSLEDEQSTPLQSVSVHDWQVQVVGLQKYPGVLPQFTPPQLVSSRVHDEVVDWHVQVDALQVSLDREQSAPLQSVLVQDCVVPTHTLLVHVCPVWQFWADVHCTQALVCVLQTGVFPEHDPDVQPVLMQALLVQAWPLGHWLVIVHCTH